ncbi:MAG TPA: hotdog fold thioesterase [Puia sp.]|jgi:1,4-dihydroxy-2-naphthoyl-CoA hydrolase|nr:hotdog fold thioesterase [Puia sp.]
MSIWFKKDINLEKLNQFSTNTMNELLGISITEIGENFIKATMPVDKRTHQAYGILHGGASAALAETLGSIGSVIIVDPEEYICVGVEINANHIRSVRDGYVTGTAIPLHIGASSHVWEIRIVDKNEKLVCVSRLTVFVKKRKPST